MRTLHPTDRSALVKARAQLAAARTARLTAQAGAAAKAATLATLARTASPTDPKLAAAQQDAAAQAKAASAARQKEAAALAAVVAAVNAWLPPDPGADLLRLSAGYPIVLLPVRLETRFAPERSELLVRIYPDEISADGHEVELATDERAAGQAYWTASQTAGGEQLDGWRTLLASYPAPRAAWIVRVTDPKVTAAAAPDKPPGWSRAVEARLLPDRFVVTATRGTTIKRAVGTAIVEPLAMSISPDEDDADLAPFSPDGTLVLDDAVKWTVDFDAAVAAGMGIRLPLDADDLRAGFDRLTVLGVKTSLDAPSSAAGLGALFDAHHYKSGLAFVKQGTPTNNLAGSPPAYPPPDDNGARSFAVERGAALDTATDGAAAAVTAAFALPAGVFTHVDGAELRETTPAGSMNRVLFSATLGYYLDQMLAPLVGRATVDAIGRHFAQWVLPRGSVPAIRIGRAPYGILPVTSLARWQHADKTSPFVPRLVTLLQQLRATWLAAAAQAPRIGRTADADQDLLDVLSMDASARQVRVRRVLGDTVYLNLTQLFNWPAAAWQTAHATTGRAALTSLGLDPTVRPRVVGLNYADNSWSYHGPLVDIVPSSETATLQQDYITWIKGAAVAALRSEAVPAAWSSDVKRVLLYRFLRHSALADYHWWAGQLLAQFAAPGASTVQAAWSEPELVGVVPGTEARATPWQRLDAHVQLPNAGVVAISTLLDGDDEQLRALTGVGDFRDALATLAPLATAELERLFTESLDAASHRLDAWITSLASRRLAELHTAQAAAPGCFVGAYGWVEELRPAVASPVTLPDGSVGRTTPGGYIQAPSMAHAMTAAVLRNAYLTHAASASSPYAVDLSSAQVRVGRFVLDSVRNGQPAGAVLGYLLERALHERQVEVLIDPLRQVAPLVANKVEDSGQPADTVAARNVVDGLVLRTKWKANQLFDVPGGLANPPHRDVLEQELTSLDTAIDAVADLLLAESVHQTIRGSTPASAAGLDALAQGTRPPDPDVARVPVGGTTLTHRLALVLPATPVAAPGWPAAPTPRAACEPRFDAWMASRLGDPRNVRCRVQYPNSAQLLQTVTVSLDQLGLCALDAVALARAAAGDPAASELDRRVLDAAFPGGLPSDAAAGVSFSILYAADPSWNRATTRTFPELLDLANAAVRVVGGLRELAPMDLVPPENASRAGDAQVQSAEAAVRVQAAQAALSAAAAALAASVSAVPDGGAPTVAQSGALQQQLARIAAFGIAAAFPSFGGQQEGGVSPLPLLDQARAVLNEARQRLSQAAAVADPAAQAQAIFGRDFTLLTGFSFPATSAAGAELTQALAYGPTMLSGRPHAVEQWLTQASHVREPLGRLRLLNVLGAAAGATPAVWQLAQLPHAATASWVGLPPAPGETRLSGTMSLALATAGTVTGTDTWYGVFVDEWVETIPDDRQHTGIAFRYEDTGNEAPQAILVAVPPTDAPSWDLDTLAAIVDETLDLAKIRAVDLETLDPLAQILPTIFLAANAGDDTISTPLAGIRDAVILGKAQT